MLKEQNPILEKAVNRLVYISADEQLRYELNMREKAELDYWSDLAESREEGLEQGLTTAISGMLAEGLPDAQIKKILKISDKEFDGLKKKYAATPN